MNLRIGHYNGQNQNLLQNKIQVTTFQGALQQKRSPTVVLTQYLGLMLYTLDSLSKVTVSR